MKEVALSNRSVWSLVREDLENERRDALSGKTGRSAGWFENSVLEAAAHLKLSLLVSEKTLICLGDQQSERLEDLLRDRSNQNRREIEKCFLKTSEKLPELAGGWHLPDGDVHSFATLAARELNAQGDEEDYNKLCSLIDSYEDSRDGGPFHDLHTWYLGLHVRMPYVPSRDEFDDYLPLRLTRTQLRDLGANSSGNFLESVSSVALPNIDNLDWDDIFELRRNEFWPHFRRFVDDLQQKQTAPNMVSDEIYSAMRNYFRKVRPNMRSSTIVNIASAAPLGPMPVNPVGLYVAGKTIKGTWDTIRKYGWIWFLLDAMDKVDGRPDDAHPV